MFSNWSWEVLLKAHLVRFISNPLCWTGIGSMSQYFWTWLYLVAQTVKRMFITLLQNWGQHISQVNTQSQPSQLKMHILPSERRRDMEACGHRQWAWSPASSRSAQWLPSCAVASPVTPMSCRTALTVQPFVPTLLSVHLAAVNAKIETWCFSEEPLCWNLFCFGFCYLFFVCLFQQWR